MTLSPAPIALTRRGLLGAGGATYHPAPAALAALVGERIGFAVMRGAFSGVCRIAYPNRAFAEACTIRHLLCHAAGLGSLFDRPGYDKHRPYARMADLLGAFAAAPPAFAPGSSAACSNEGFVVLGAVIEAVTGASSYDLLESWIYRSRGDGCERALLLARPARSGGAGLSLPRG